MALGRSYRGQVKHFLMCDPTTSVSWNLAKLEGGGALSSRHNGINLVFHPSLDRLHNCPFWKYIYRTVKDSSWLLKMIIFLKILILFNMQLPTDGQAGQHTGPSRVAAVGPYIQSSTMPRGQVRQDPLVKPAYPDGTATLPAHDPRSHSGTGEYVVIPYRRSLSCHFFSLHCYYRYI